MDFPEQVAQNPQPYADSFATLPQRTTAPQSWMVRVAAAKYHWYDLIAGFAEKPDIRDPIGRYMRRMQFELEATAEKRHLFFAVTRPRVRFDIAGVVQWGFFSLKLTLPLLMGAEQTKESITVELKVPFAATMKKPTVILTENFISLNWGGLVEVFSVHDLLQTYAHTLKLPSKVAYVGQTRDPEGQLGKGRLPALHKLRAQYGMDYDTLLLVVGLEVEVSCADGDPAALPHNEHPMTADVLHAERADVIEAALIRYFEGSNPRWRQLDERKARAERLAAVQAANNLVQYTIDLALAPEDTGHYSHLASEFVSAANRHLLSCYIADGQAQVAAMPLPAPAKGGKG
ncbi:MULTISPECIES: hypothetical protein [unclassified Duganella]|uniref:hypothetical protein n=1 Tax=unclassified Duganella TaxID=2636909 RepID=UPI00088C7BDF|nr:MULTISPECIES: hypothetical protein [unclassified Duganella]SDH32708.1 hypothetical protein SAMN05216320_11249 [Duganella sp. OV458]SDK49432.1 hypothetical protein SAMN05428973_11249 [Duganella sp. OV510]